MGSRDKRVYDIALEAEIDGELLRRTVAVSADVTLPEMYRTFQGTLETNYISEHVIEHKGELYAGGRGSRTPLRSVFEVGDVFVCHKIMANISATATVLRTYEVQSRRHYPKVLDGKGTFANERSLFSTQMATWSAQNAAKGHYLTREQSERLDRRTAASRDTLPELIANLGGSFSTVPELAGFFVALLCGPPVMPSAYLSLLIGEKAKFADLDDANRVLSILMEYHNEVVGHLQSGYVPSLQPRGSTPLSFGDVEAWSKGFYQGIELAIDAWKPILTHPSVKPTLEILYGFAFNDDDNMMVQVLRENSTQARELRHILPNAVLDLYAFCKRYFLDSLIGQIPIRRDSEKVGKNVVCPCGSGKKYKRCCGA